MRYIHTTNVKQVVALLAHFLITRRKMTGYERYSVGLVARDLQFYVDTDIYWKDSKTVSVKTKAQFTKKDEIISFKDYYIEFKETHDKFIN